MLYFCSVNDLKLVLPSASRFDNEFDRARKSVTQEMNTYMRRTLDYGAHVEYHDAPLNNYGKSFNIWLANKNVEPGSLDLRYSTARDWSDENVIIADAILLDAPNGKLTVYHPTRQWTGALRIAYIGGYRAMLDGQGAETDVMDCPEFLRIACITECTYRLDKLLNNNTNRSEDMEKAQKIVEAKKVGGLLYSTAMAITQFRKPMGTLLG